jgi:hypothetical protein
VTDGWCWFVLREEYCWLVAGGWFDVREKYCWLVADKPSEQGEGVTGPELAAAGAGAGRDGGFPLWQKLTPKHSFWSTREGDINDSVWLRFFLSK